MLGYSPAPPPSPSVGCAIYCLLAYPANWAFLKFVAVPGKLKGDIDAAMFLLCLSPISLPVELALGGLDWLVYFAVSLGRILF